jgi:hypothetical protein
LRALGAPFLDRTQAQIFAVEAHEIEYHERGALSALPGDERGEVCQSIQPLRERLALRFHRRSLLASTTKLNKRPFACSGRSNLFRARNGMTAIARTPVFPEATPEGVLSAP